MNAIRYISLCVQQFWYVFSQFVFDRPRVADNQFSRLTIPQMTYYFHIEFRLFLHLLQSPHEDTQKHSPTHTHTCIYGLYNKIIFVHLFSGINLTCFPRDSICDFHFWSMYVKNRVTAESHVHVIYYSHNQRV